MIGFSLAERDMLKFLADENFNNDIVRGVLRQNASIDLARAIDVGLQGASDPELLEWAASQGRVVLTHDVTTLIAFAYDRVAMGLPIPGVFEVNGRSGYPAIISEILLLAECSQAGEWEGQVCFLPLS